MFAAEAARLVGREKCVNNCDDKRDKKQPGRKLAVLSYESTEKEDEDITGKGVYAAAGLGCFHFEDNLFCAEVKGPNVTAGAGQDESGVRAFAKAEVGSVSVSVGAIKS